MEPNSEIDTSPPAESGPDAPKSSSPGEAIRQLSAIVLSVDWEINDQVMVALLKETERLESVFSRNFTESMMLKLLGAVGRYILGRKAQAHQGAIGLLNSIFHSFDSMVRNEQMDESEKKQCLLVEIQKFKELKNQIASQKIDAASEHRTHFTSSEATPFGSPKVKEEIRNIIRAELSDIRNQLEDIRVALIRIQKR